MPENTSKYSVAERQWLLDRRINQTGITFGEFPVDVGKKPFMFFSNYLGQEHDPKIRTFNVLPTVWAWSAVACKLDTEVIAIGREGTLHNTDPEEVPLIERGTVIVKKVDGIYKGDDYTQARIQLTLLNNGVVISAPAATTLHDGLLMSFDIRPFKSAIIYGVPVAAMALHEGFTPQGLRIANYVEAREIDLQIKFANGIAKLDKDHIAQAYGKIVMATIASMVPSTQEKGDFYNPEKIMRDSMNELQEYERREFITLNGAI